MNPNVILAAGLAILVASFLANYSRDESTAIATASASAPYVDMIQAPAATDDAVVAREQEQRSDNAQVVDESAQMIEAWRKYALEHVARATELETMLQRERIAANNYADKLMLAGEQLRECVQAKNQQARRLPTVRANGLVTTCYREGFGYFDCEVIR